MTKMAEKHYPFGAAHTLAYSPYKGVTPGILHLTCAICVNSNTNDLWGMVLLTLSTNISVYCLSTDTP